MRLLNTKTIMLEEFFGSIPKYAILSHTWGEDEVTFQDMQRDLEKTRVKKGYQKILSTCREALRNGWEYAWVDTCCIDKTSSAELSEAINSMFAWYQMAQICYTLLEDVPPAANLRDVGEKFVKSRWFTRGWTLQELLAPRALIFYASDWSIIATRGTMASQIAAASEIDQVVLREIESSSVNLPQLLRGISVAERMSWASQRDTTRVEDIAYCLLGIFGVNMPLLYGEGKRAFRRLQEEIIKSSNDESIFAWGAEYFPCIGRPLRKHPKTKNTACSALSGVSESIVDGIKSEAVWGIGAPDGHGIFAEAPLAFIECGDIVQCRVDDAPASSFSITNLGVHIELPMGWISSWPPSTAQSEVDGYYALLQCRRKSIHDCPLAIPIQSAPSHSPNVWHRRADYLMPVNTVDIRMFSPRSIYLTADPEPRASRVLKFWIRLAPQEFDIDNIQVSDTCTWDPKSRCLSIDSPDTPEVSLGFIKVPFIVPVREQGSSYLMGIHLRVRAPFKLFSWPMPWWADYSLTSSIPPWASNAWFVHPTMPVDGSRYLVLPDSRVVKVRIASQIVQGARFFVVDIGAYRTAGILAFLFPTSPPVLRFFNQALRIFFSMRETAESYLYFISYRSMNMQSHIWLGRLWNWRTASVFLAFMYVPYYAGASSTPRSAVNIFAFHAVDFTWNAIAAFWETRDNRLGKKGKAVPTIVECGIYALLTKLALVQSRQAFTFLVVLNIFMVNNVSDKRYGFPPAMGLYFLSLFIFPLLHNVLECGGLQC